MTSPPQRLQQIIDLDREAQELRPAQPPSGGFDRLQQALADEKSAPVAAPIVFRRKAPAHRLGRWLAAALLIGSAGFAAQKWREAASTPPPIVPSSPPTEKSTLPGEAASPGTSAEEVASPPDSEEAVEQEMPEEKADSSPSTETKKRALSPQASQQGALRKPSHKPLHEPRPQEDSFAADLALLKQAQQQLASGQYSAVLSTLQNHSTRFPKSQFSLDRAALRAIALCQSGSKSSGSAAAGKLLKRNPSSIYTERLKNACGI